MTAVAPSSQPSLWSMVLQRSTHHSKLRVLLSGVLEEKIREAPKPAVGRAADMPAQTRFAGRQQASWSATKLAASSSEHTRMGVARYASATELRKSSDTQFTSAGDATRRGVVAHAIGEEEEKAVSQAELDASSFKSTGTSVDERGTTPTASVASALESICLQDGASCKSVLGRAASAAETPPSDDIAEPECCADGVADADVVAEETPSTIAVLSQTLKKVWEADLEQETQRRLRECGGEATQATQATLEGGAGSSSATAMAHSSSCGSSSSHGSSPEMTGAAPSLPSTQVCRMADLAPPSADDVCGNVEPESAPWHRLCYECGGVLDGSAYMLNDRAYCSEKHRLVASRREYFATRAKAGYREGVNRSQSDETQLRCRPATVMPPSPSYGLLAQYKTWC